MSDKVVSIHKKQLENLEKILELWAIYNRQDAHTPDYFNAVLVDGKGFFRPHRVDVNSNGEPVDKVVYLADFSDLQEELFYARQAGLIHEEKVRTQQYVLRDNKLGFWVYIKEGY